MLFERIRYSTIALLGYFDYNVFDYYFKNIPTVYLLFPKPCVIIQVKSEQERSRATSVTRIIMKGVNRNETVYYDLSV